ncbi:unnamed protein product [Meloidogyne enterolobii]|uniref:Uncharacterized protein n=1 Tax=Meloidogyne enterolobii TaxID=390850 RepID=A0ACB1A8Y3_MELEN
MFPFPSFFRPLIFDQYHILPIRLKTYILSTSLLTKCEILALLAKCRFGKIWCPFHFSPIFFLLFFLLFKYFSQVILLIVVIF